MKALYLLIAIAAAIFAVVNLWGWLFGDEITVHLMFCNGQRTGNICHGTEETANPTTYKVSVDRQEVMYWTWNGGQLDHFPRCTVRNKYNWSCTWSKPTDEEAPRYHNMIDGEYSEPSNDAFNQLFYPVGRWYWWKVRFTEKDDHFSTIWQDLQN